MLITCVLCYSIFLHKPHTEMFSNKLEKNREYVKEIIVRYEVLKALNILVVRQGSTLKMEAMHSSETSEITHKTTRLTNMKPQLTME